MKIKQASQHGVISIEFALAFPAFILMVMLWAEISYLGFVSSVVDMASSTAVRKAKSTDIDSVSAADHSAVVKGVISKSGSFWANIVDPDKFTLSSCYFTDVADATLTVLGGCNNVSASHPVALFQLSYKYNPIYSVFGNEINLSRELIVILEYERNS